jgi:hypothetical protein
MRSNRPGCLSGIGIIAVDHCIGDRRVCLSRGGLMYNPDR